MKQSYLPDELQEVTLADLLPWEGGYVVPWAMRADEFGALWIDTSFSFERKPGGTVQMRVSKGHGGHYFVDKSTVGMEYSKCNLNMSDGVIGAGRTYAPVILK